MMRSEAEVRENLEWLQSQCIHFREDQADRIMRQLEILLWVLGYGRDEAETRAAAIWQDSRAARDHHPRDYS